MLNLTCLLKNDQSECHGLIRDGRGRRFDSCKLLPRNVQRSVSVTKLRNLVVEGRWQVSTIRNTGQKAHRQLQTTKWRLDKFLEESYSRTEIRPTFVVSSAWRPAGCCPCRRAAVDRGTSCRRAISLTGPSSRRPFSQWKGRASGQALYSAWCRPLPVPASRLQEDSDVVQSHKIWLHPVLISFIHQKVDIITK